MKTTTTKNRMSSNGTKESTLDAVIFTANGIEVQGRGLQVLGNQVKAATTLAQWKQRFAVLTATLINADISTGQQSDALTAAGLSVVDINYMQSGATAKIKPDPAQFAKKA